MSKSHSGHSLMVNDRWWNWASDRYELSNPATRLRDLLYEKLEEVKMADALAKHSNSDRESSNRESSNRESSNRENGGRGSSDRNYYHKECFEKNRDKIVGNGADKGRRWILQYPAYCGTCGRKMPVNNEAIMHTPN